MYLDAQNRFSNAQAVTATANSTNVIDLDVAARNLGAGEPLCILINVDAALVDTTGDETYTVGLQTDDNAAMTSATVIVANAVPAPARGDAIGTKYIIFLTPGLVFERYISLVYTLGGNADNAGTFTAYLMPLKSVLALALYPDNIIPK